MGPVSRLPSPVFVRVRDPVRSGSERARARGRARRRRRETGDGRRKTADGDESHTRSSVARRCASSESASTLLDQQRKSRRIEPRASASGPEPRVQARGPAASDSALRTNCREAPPMSHMSPSRDLAWRCGTDRQEQREKGQPPGRPFFPRSPHPPRSPLRHRSARNRELPFTMLLYAHRHEISVVYGTVAAKYG